MNSMSPIEQIRIFSEELRIIEQGDNTLARAKEINEIAEQLKFIMERESSHLAWEVYDSVESQQVWNTLIKTLEHKPHFQEIVDGIAPVANAILAKLDKCHESQIKRLELGIEVLMDNLKEADGNFLTLSRANQAKISCIGSLVTHLCRKGYSSEVMVIFAQLSAKEQVDRKIVSFLIREFFKEVPGRAFEVFGGWINTQKIPIHKLELAHNEMLEIAPHLLHLDINVDELCSKSWIKWWSERNVYNFLVKCKNLVCLHITTDMEELPNNFSKVRHLSLKDCYGLQRLPSNLSNITELVCDNCMMLSELSHAMHKMKKLTLVNCPKIHEMPEGLPSTCDVRLSGKISYFLQNAAR